MTNQLRRTFALLALVMVTIALTACGAKNPNGPSDNPVTPPAGGAPAWSTQKSAICSIVQPTSLPANMGSAWRAEVMGHVNEAGLSYTSKWVFRDEAGNETPGSEASGVTTTAGVDAFISNGGGIAPKKQGDYTLVGRYTETRGSESNTLTSTCAFPVK